MVIKNTFRRYYGRRKPNLRGQDGRVVKVSRLCEVLTTKLRGIEFQVAHLVSTKRPYGTSRWFQSRPRFYMAPAFADILEGRMAEWLRPRVFIAENGLNIRRISVGSKSCPSRKTMGWADGDKTTSRRYYMAGVSQI
jgi:hypothetical protein